MAKEKRKGKKTVTPRLEGYIVGWICAIPKELTIA
jgi:hypothetical protein